MLIRKCVVCSSPSTEGEVVNGDHDTVPVLFENYSNGGAAIGKRGGCGAFLGNHGGAFSSFCAELQMCNYSDGGSSHLFSASEFLKALECTTDRFIVCGPCLDIITEAMDKRQKVEKWECQVLRLQLELLQKMKVLQQCTDLYYKEMTRILERVKCSEMEETGKITYFQPREPGNDRKILDLIEFKEKIIDVVTYLGMFREDANKRFGPCLKTTGSAPISKPIPVSPKPSDNNYCEDNSGEAFNDWNDAEDDTFAEIPAGSDERLSEAHLVKQHSKISKDNPKTRVTKGNKIAKKASTRKKRESTEILKPESVVDNPDKDKTDGDDVNFSAGDELEDRNASEDQYVPLPLPKQKSKKNSDGETGVSTTSTITSGAGIKIGLKYSYNAPPMPSLKIPPLQLKQKLKQVDFSGMGEFKKSLITRIIGRNLEASLSTQSAEENTTAEDEVLCPGHPALINMENLKYYDKWNYSLATKKITVAGIEIGVSEDSPSTLTLHCSACTFQYGYTVPKIKGEKLSIPSRALNELQWKLFNHVFHIHLKAFDCSQCNAVCNTLKTFQQHVAVLHPDPDKTTSVIAYPCPTCGKIFTSKSSLRIHKVVHISKEERPHVICPLCCSRILKNGFTKHKNFQCPNRPNKEKLTPMLCPHCGKIFMKKKYLNHHVLRKHGVESSKPFKCSLCHMSFRFSADLRYHELSVHQMRKGEYVCAKCGKTFIKQVNHCKHEANCGGAGAQS